MGAVGGGIWHSVKGAKNSPRVRQKTDCQMRMKSMPNTTCFDVGRTFDRCGISDEG